jgi:hypothetical protein
LCVDCCDRGQDQDQHWKKTRSSLHRTPHP